MRAARCLLPAALFALAACSGETSDPPQALVSQTPGNDTVAASLANLAELRTLASAMSETRLATVLDGNGGYSVLAPTDAAFAALGPRGKALLTQDRQPLLIALLRGHILPGQVTPDAIAKAIERKRGPVQMTTMSGAIVTFAKDEQGLTVSTGGAAARLSSQPTVATNGAILPIDAVLLPAR